MILYFGTNGRLLETVTEYELESGSKSFITSSGNISSNKIFAYFEGEEPTILQASVTYILPNGSVFENSSLPADAIVEDSILLDLNRDLTYFKYGKTYRFVEFDLPAALLTTGGEGVYQANFTLYPSTDQARAYGDFSFKAEGSPSQLVENEITDTQYHLILARFSNCVPYTGATADVDLGNYSLTANQVYLSTSYSDVDYSAWLGIATQPESRRGLVYIYDGTHNRQFNFPNDGENLQNIATREWATQGFVPLTREIAGISLESDITKEALSGALGVGNYMPAFNNHAADITPNAYIDYHGVLYPHDDLSVIKINCYGAKTATYNATMSTPDYRGFAFYDKNDNVLAAYQISAVPQTVNVPNGAVYAMATFETNPSVFILDMNVSDLCKDNFDFKSRYVSKDDKIYLFSSNEFLKTNNLAEVLEIEGDRASKNIADIQVGYYAIEFTLNLRTYTILTLGGNTIFSGWHEAGKYKTTFYAASAGTLNWTQYLTGENPITSNIKVYLNDKDNPVLHKNSAYPLQNVLNPYDFEVGSNTTYIYKNDNGIKVSFTGNTWQPILIMRGVDLSSETFNQIDISFDCEIVGADITVYLQSTEIGRLYEDSKHFRYTFRKDDLQNASALSNFYIQFACGANCTLELKNFTCYFDRNGASFKQKVNYLNFYEYPLERLIRDGGMARCFKSIMCIGDSLTEGVFDYDDNGNTNWTVISEYSYPSQMKRLLGNEVINAGVGGTTSKTWYNSQADAYLISDKNCDAYIIALGTNDIGDVGQFTGNILTDIDENDYNYNADTSVGWYARIIERIQSINPKAKIFCVTIPMTRNGTNRYEANRKIKQIANKFNCYVIDLQEYYVNGGNVDSFKAKYYNGGHLNALGYLNLAYVYTSYIDFIINTNLSDFNEIQFINTNYNFKR